MPDIYQKDVSKFNCWLRAAKREDISLYTLDLMIPSWQRFMACEELSKRTDAI